MPTTLPFLMKTITTGPTLRCCNNRIPTGLLVAISVSLIHQNAFSIPVVNLGTASSFAILAGSEITDAGGVSTIVAGDVGLSPATGAAIGLTSLQVLGGTTYAVNAAGPFGSVNAPGLLAAAKNDLTDAYNDAFNRPFTIDYGVEDNQLGGKTLYPGVYRFGHAATANLIGTLTLDANGDPNPVWIFQATSDLITAAGSPGNPGSSVALINGAASCNVYWQVGSSATIGTYSDFVGNIMADQSISLQAYATLNGSALARIAAVTLDHNTIIKDDCDVVTVPEAGSSVLLLASGIATVGIVRRRFSNRP